MKIFLKIFGFLKKYKLFHIAFWVYSTVQLYHLFKVHGRPASTDEGYLVIIKAVEIVAVYTMLLVLVPRFLNKGKFLKFFGLVFLSFFAFAGLEMLLQDAFLYIVEGRHLRKAFWFILYSSHVVDIFINCVIFFGVVVIPDKFTMAIRNSRLEKERLETELNFLKLQINPHFLFNAINSIYVLIEEDKKMASEVLLKFSSLLRYQLYDCSKEYMPLHTEVAFLKDYIALESLRNGDNIVVDLKVDPQIGHMEIPPFMLIPFVENSFKHISRHTDKPNYINMKLQAQDDYIVFAIENSFEPHSTEVVKRSDSGIGLQNVKRRLELLYPNTHQLDIAKHTEKFAVDLKLKIHEAAMHTS